MCSFFHKIVIRISIVVKFEYGWEQYPGLLCQRIVGCIFNSVELIITREISCILYPVIKHNLHHTTTRKFTLLSGEMVSIFCN
jgi:hypothetical protein